MAPVAWPRQHPLSWTGERSLSAWEALRLGRLHWALRNLIFDGLRDGISCPPLPSCLEKTTIRACRLYATPLHSGTIFSQNWPPKFRLGGLTDVRGVIPVEDLKMLSTNGTGLPARELPESARRITGDIIVALSDGDFISFAARPVPGDKALVAIKDYRLFPLTLPNVARNVIAHEFGHAIGLSHNADPTMLMCGRPASCRPDLFTSEVPKYFPLNEAEKAHLRRMYSPSWPAPG